MTGLVMRNAQNVFSGLVRQAVELLSGTMVGGWKIETEALIQVEQMFIVVSLLVVCLLSVVYLYAG